MSKIHDNIIKSYTVDLENNEIWFNTVYYYNDITEEIIVDFNNVMGHLFSNVIKNSIIFEINKNSINDFLKDNNEILLKNKDYGFPFNYKNEEDLRKILNENKQKYYKIHTSYGLDGWILAEEMKITVKK